LTMSAWVPSAMFGSKEPPASARLREIRVRLLVFSKYKKERTPFFFTFVDGWRILSLRHLPKIV